MTATQPEPYDGRVQQVPVYDAARQARWGWRDHSSGRARRAAP
ncbi:hypothetical protein [Kribbella turkmenica]|nr:hypothetical protein [Kribbella turkmenica]